MNDNKYLDIIERLTVRNVRMREALEQIKACEYGCDMSHCGAVGVARDALNYLDSLIIGKPIENDSESKGHTSNDR
jgi:hypothetical protein